MDGRVLEKGILMRIPKSAHKPIEQRWPIRQNLLQAAAKLRRDADDIEAFASQLPEMTMGAESVLWKLLFKRLQDF